MTDYTPELESWFKSITGKYVDIDGKHGAQCTDIPKSWLKVQFNEPNKTGGNGRDVARNIAKRDGWAFVGPTKPALPGDVSSWDEGWGGLWEDGELVFYGHTAVVVRDLGDRLEVIQQNPRSAHKATVGKDGLVGYARPPKKVVKATSARTHKVAAGETFWSIAVSYGLKPADVVAMNPDIKPEQLKPGTIINLPADTRTHTVVKGDTLYAIARKYNTNVIALKTLNPGINANVLSVGQKITVR